MSMSDKNFQYFQLNALALAVLATLGAMSAHADDDEAAALKKPANFMSLGVTNVNGQAVRFGEYNGLDKSVVTVNADVSVRDGTAYQHNEDGGTGRWSLTGNDLGLSSRTLGASLANQGAWNIGLGYDELTHRLADTYQTPYKGDMGGHSFALPVWFGTAANTNTLNAAQRSALTTLDIATKRVNSSVNAGVNITPRLSLNVDFNHLEQTGAKLMAFGAFGSTRPAATAGLGVTNSAVSILPLPTDYQTDTVTLAANWMGERSHATLSYFGSFFHEGFDRVSIDTFAGANKTQTMTTAPSNEFHQLNLSGGYALSPRTKLAGTISHGRNTQNSVFVTPDTGMLGAALPKTSLDGLVVTTHADLKLTDRTSKNLVLSAAWRYDLRDNQTESNIYNFYSIRDTNPVYPNTPLSNKKNRLELAGDYRIKPGHQLRVELDHEEIDRWCRNYAVLPPTYPEGTNCVVADNSREDKLDTTYRIKASDAVNLNLGYAYSKRNTNLDPSAVAAFNSTKAGSKGLNAGDFLGFAAYFADSKKQQIAKASGNWQVNDMLSLGLGGRYTDDVYDVTYGVKNGNTWSLNLDASYAYSSKGSVTSYVTQQHRQRDMTNLQLTTPAVAATATAIGVPANATWTNKLKDDDITVGLGVKHNGLMRGKLDVTGDITYTLSETGYSTQLNYNAATSTGLTCAGTAFMTCGDLPVIRSETFQFKLTGTYHVEKNASLALGYAYQRLNASDYYYNAYQYGNTPATLMPSNQQVGEYAVNLVSLSYIKKF